MRNSLKSQLTFDKSFSSSSPVLAPNRMASPKSFTASPGITVSRSITQMPFLVSLSTIILFSLVSLCVTRRGIFPSASKSPSTQAVSFRDLKNSISSRAFSALLHTSASTASRNTWYLAFVS